MFPLCNLGTACLVHSCSSWRVCSRARRWTSPSPSQYRQVDSFEHVVAAILQREGYWTQTCLKVELTPEDKSNIGRKSSPRWELDVVGYRGRDNSIMVLECKSFLDSTGVQTRTFLGENEDNEKYYKLFFEDRTRDVVLARLCAQLVQKGFCAPDPSVRFGLAAGKIQGDVTKLTAQFQNRGWELWTPQDIREKLLKLADSSYENSVASVVAKIVLRNEARGPVI